MKTIYEQMSIDELENHFSGFLIDSWSFSKVSCFSRNEKEFEMRYIYGVRPKQSANTIAGSAYHKSVEWYFEKYKKQEIADVVDLQHIAYAFIENIDADKWKTQKTTPSVLSCIEEATKTVYQAIGNFLSEIKTYTSELKKVLDVELMLSAWIKINGVDVPLPCNAVIDLVVQLTNGKNVIIDHKLKKSFTDEKEAAYIIAKQAIIYAKIYEKLYGIEIHEVWFIENKPTKNKDGTSQLNPIKVVLDDQTRHLYEALLYEPIKRMIEAVSDPNYIYLINDSDNFVDKAELYEFWTKTILAEVDGFNINENKKELVENRTKKIRDASLISVTPNVIKNFQNHVREFIPYDITNKNMTNEQKIEHTLRCFRILAKVQYTYDGYSSSSYLIEINAGTSISAVSKYKLDLASALGVSNVRIHKDLCVLDGKSYLVIESALKTSMKLMWDEKKLSGLKIPIGIDNFKKTIYWDLENPSTPHMLVCGATGSGKSMLIKSTLKYATLAGVDNIIIFDPKHEFKRFNSASIEVICEIEDIEEKMMNLVAEMEKRVKHGNHKNTMVVFDEFADAVANSRKGKELFGKKSLEENLRILLQKGRSSGFRVVAATQRASVKVITGDSKVNFPVQVCFRVPKEVDSIVVLDEPGAESLNGKGDGLIKSPEYFGGVIRFQGFLC